MYICVCQAVTERQVQMAFDQGATRLRDLRAMLGVTQDCGRCATCAHACLKKLGEVSRCDSSGLVSESRYIASALSLETAR